MGRIYDEHPDNCPLGLEEVCARAGIWGAIRYGSHDSALRVLGNDHFCIVSQRRHGSDPTAKRLPVVVHALVLFESCQGDRVHGCRIFRRVVSDQQRRNVSRKLYVRNGWKADIIKESPVGNSEVYAIQNPIAPDDQEQNRARRDGRQQQ